MSILAITFVGNLHSLGSVSSSFRRLSADTVEPLLIKGHFAVPQIRFLSINLPPK